MITVTENAVKQLQALLATRPDAGGLRLQVSRGGCAGMEYLMKLDSAAEGDEVIEPEGSGVRVFVDAESRPYLDGCEVDYSDALADSGFKVHNPNAARSCGCGSSFEPRPAGG